MAEYPNFAALAKAERRGEDFEIVRRFRPASNVAIIAPHGGGVEPGTSEIATAIAGDDLNLYCFEGPRPRGNGGLHIKSTNYDEPDCLELLRSCDHVVAIHGCAEGTLTTYLGGGDTNLRDAIGARLAASGFHIGVHPSPDLQGVSPHNICNKGRRGCGAQLELSADLRRKLKTDDAERVRYAAAIRSALPRW